MTLTPGVHEVGAGEAEAAAVEGARAGARVFVLSCGGVSDRAGFFDVVRASLPLDPFLRASESWDALLDALWGGIDGLDTSVVVISWKGASTFRERAPEEFARVKALLSDLARSLGRREDTDGEPKQVCVYAS